MKKINRRQALSKRLNRVYDILLDRYGPQKCFLDHEGAFQLLAATILSAQCTDKKVNAVTPELFRRYPDAAAMSAADVEELEGIIRVCGFYHAKAGHLRAMAEVIAGRYHGEVPRTMEELTALPGVGRKTANVVLGDAMGIPGLPVDTHVKRIARLAGFSKSDDPEKIEAELCGALEPERWAQFSHLLILHGRTCCTARKPDCARCEIAAFCQHVQPGAVRS